MPRSEEQEESIQQKVPPERFYDLEAAAKTDIGCRRTENQDSYGSVHSRKISVFIVADGMGGTRGGARASGHAVHILNHLVFDEQESISCSSITSAIKAANSLIYADSRACEGLGGMGTTAVLLAFCGERCIIAHVGDSRIYRIKADNIQQVTRDHTLVQELVDTGALKPEEAENHPISHMLTRSLGPTEQVEVDCRELADTEAGDRFVLCSDGLFNHVSEEEILEEVSAHSQSRAADELVGLALERGGSDNITVQIIELLPTKKKRAARLYPSSGFSREAVGSFEIDNGEELIEKALALKALHPAGALHPVEDGEEGETSADVERDTSAMQGSAMHGADLGLSDEDLEQDLQVEEGAQLPSVESSIAVSTKGKGSAAQDGLWRRAAASAVLGVTVGVVYYAATQYGAYQDRAYQDRNVVATATAGKQGETEPSVGSEEIASELYELAYAGVQPVDGSKTASSENATSEAEALLIASLGNFSSLQLLPEIDEQELAISTEQLRLEPAPMVRIPGLDPDAPRPTQPIVWENEKRRLPEDSMAEASGDPAVTSGGKNPRQSELFTDAEMLRVVEEKAELRRELADLDAKIRSLGLKSVQEALGKIATLEKQVLETSEKMAELRKQVEADQTMIDFWSSSREEAGSLPAKETLNRLAENSEIIEEAVAAYQKASESYYSSVDAWDAQPNDISLAAKMGENGRALQQLQIALSESIKRVSKRKIAELATAVARNKVELSSLAEAADQLSRHSGYFRAYTDAPASQRKGLRDSYLEQRAELVAELKILSEMVSDRKEVRFRRKVFYTAALKN